MIITIFNWKIISISSLASYKPLFAVFVQQCILIGDLLLFTVIAVAPGAVMQSVPGVILVLDPIAWLHPIKFQCTMIEKPTMSELTWKYQQASVLSHGIVVVVVAPLSTWWRNIQLFTCVDLHECGMKIMALTFIALTD